METRPPLSLFHIFSFPYSLPLPTSRSPKIMRSFPSQGPFQIKTPCVFPLSHSFLLSLFLCPHPVFHATVLLLLRTHIRTCSVSPSPLPRAHEEVLQWPDTSYCLNVTAFDLFDCVQWSQCVRVCVHLKIHTHTHVQCRQPRTPCLTFGLHSFMDPEPNVLMAQKREPSAWYRPQTETITQTWSGHSSYGERHTAILVDVW